MIVDLINLDGEVETVVYGEFMGFDHEETGCHLLLGSGTALKNKGAKDGLYILLGKKWHRIEPEGLED